MGRKFLVSMLLAAGLAVGPTLAAVAYTIDPVHSHLGFSVRHLGVSNVRGEFKEYSATLLVDETNLTQSSVEVRIKASRIFTGDENRDKHLRGPDFFDVDKHPELVFKSKKIEKRSQDYLVTGDLTIRGVTKEIQMPLAVAGPINDPFGMKRIGVEGSVTINRQDYGINWNRLMDTGGLIVGNEVKIDFSIEATRKAEPPPAGDTK